MHLFALVNNCAAIRMVKPGEDFYQGGLARAVVANQGKYFSLTELNAHVYERRDGAEGLADMAHLEDDRSVQFESGNILLVHMRLRARIVSTCTFRIMASTIAVPK